MPSPFPGMDPYLEGHLWQDVHHRLATEISRRLTPLLRPRYVARLAVYVIEDESPEAEIGILYPDVEVLASTRAPSPSPLPDGKPAPPASATFSPPLTIPLLTPVAVRLVEVEIRDTTRSQLVTSIEILSPVNKRGRGLEKYRQKRQRLQQSAVHLLEIDLLRRGTRPPDAHPKLPECAYLVTLTRARCELRSAARSVRPREVLRAPSRDHRGSRAARSVTSRPGDRQHPLRVLRVLRDERTPAFKASPRRARARTSRTARSRSRLRCAARSVRGTRALGERALRAARSPAARASERC